MNRTNTFLLLFFLPLFTFCTSAGSEEVKDFYSASGAFPQEVRTPPMPHDVTFAGEEVPLHYFDVRESLMRELTGLSFFHGTMIYTMQLNNRYGGEIKRILREEGVPEDFYYVCVAESGLRPVVSPAKAEGYWQFLARTAKEYGLVVDGEVDERYNIEKSTRAAAAYFKKAYKEFGSWSLAAASYNTGMRNVRYRVDIQSEDNYHNMQLIEETGRYLYRAIAFKIILNNRERYGFYLSQEDLYKPLDYFEVEVSGKIDNWSDFARSHGTNFKMIKMYNEWIRANYLHNRSGRNYTVRVPVKGFRES